MSAAVGESLTRSVEDYLKAIYQLSPEGQPAATNDIAHLLELSAPSVTGMVKRLSEHGLLEHVPYRGVQLTDEGRRAALRMVRRHRLIEAYLVEFLGYSWDTVHAEAERLEHAVSDTMVERMASHWAIRRSIPMAIRSRPPTARSPSSCVLRYPTSR